ncbi:S100P-binding protein-like [Phascolarctos cinereus]|uniref:S100P-binding protein n=1 Tax=Phascolarctos cinereus TaxID=38626 RepID=A0A6P5KCX5_PHACI|nr:S100P-binding protein-like [Phascolarctos cinereus]
MSKDMSCYLESPPGCDSTGSGEHLLPALGTSGATSGQDEDELDDSLLELSDGEEDDSPFSYTEEEIQELLKDDDSLNNQSSLGGGLKNTGGQMEKLGRDGCVLLDSPLDINSPCSLELGAGPASILQLPQTGSPSAGKSSLGSRRHKIGGANQSPAASSSSSKHIILDKNSGKMVAHDTRRVSKITPLLPTRTRSKYLRFSQAELEPKMQIALKNGLTHIPKPRALHHGSLGELYALMDQVGSVEYQIRNRRWQHLSALTMFQQKPLHRYSLT